MNSPIVPLKVPFFGLSLLQVPRMTTLLEFARKSGRDHQHPSSNPTIYLRFCLNHLVSFKRHWRHGIYGACSPFVPLIKGG